MSEAKTQFSNGAIGKTFLMNFIVTLVLALVAYFIFDMAFDAFPSYAEINGLGALTFVNVISMTLIGNLFALIAVLLIKGSSNFLRTFYILSVIFFLLLAVFPFIAIPDAPNRMYIALEIMHFIVAIPIVMGFRNLYNKS